VKTGERTKNKIQILQGLSKGDTIITTGLLEVRDGMPVEIKELMEVGI
jgi:membrane fusion protein (multidrug efflux system)